MWAQVKKKWMHWDFKWDFEKKDFGFLMLEHA